MQLPAPAPDPAQFDWGPNQVVTHQALNADFYGPWYEFTALINALNATGSGAYVCGPCVSSVANGTGVSAALGAQSSGVGTQLTIGLAHGDYVDTSNAQTISGAKTFANNLKAATLESGSTPSYVPPVYTAVGAAAPTSLHGVEGTVTITTTATVQCTAPCVVSQYTGGNVALSGAAAFSSASSYACQFAAPFNAIVGGIPSSGTAFAVAIYQTGGAPLAESKQYTIPYSCLGT